MLYDICASRSVISFATIASSEFSCAILSVIVVSSASAGAIIWVSCVSISASSVAISASMLLITVSASPEFAYSASRLSRSCARFAFCWSSIWF